MGHIIDLVVQYGRYVTPRITAMLLRREGCTVNHKRVERKDMAGAGAESGREAEEEA